MASWFTTPSEPRQRIVSVTIPDCAVNDGYCPPPCSGKFVGAYAIAEGNPGGGGATVTIYKGGTALCTIPIGPAQGGTIRRSSAPIANAVVEYTGDPLVIKTVGGGAAKSLTVQLFFLAAQ